MKKRYKLSVAVITVLCIGLIAINSVSALSPIPTNEYALVDTTAENSLKPRDRYVSTQSELSSLTTLKKIEELKEAVPKTYEETETRILVRTRFLMWTHDGVHIMWGHCGNNFFIGIDDLGKRCWGIYGNGVFAGLYDGAFFWGRYNAGYWKAEGLFGLKNAHGRYVLFPTISTINPTTENL